MVTRQERALRNAVILLAVATLVLGGLLFWSLRAMALLKAETAEGKPRMSLLPEDSRSRNRNG